MTDSNKGATDDEAILITLDQISQTIDVMTSVVGRLRTHMQQREASTADLSRSLGKEMRPDRVLH